MENCDVITYLSGHRGMPKRVGTLTRGCAPDADDWTRWGVKRADVISASWKRRQGRLVYWIELAPPGTLNVVRNMQQFVDRVPINSPAAVRKLERLAKTWAEIADDDEAAPTGAMLRVVNRLLHNVKQHRKFMADARMWLDMLARSDDDPRPKELLQTLDAMLGVKRRGRTQARK